MRKPVAQLRVIHYLENEVCVEGKAASMGAHTDYECFTLLHQRAEGLQVHHPELGWFTMPVIEGTLVLLVGDMLEALSNGAFKSPLHRVINSNRERYSLPYFVATDFDAVIEPHPALVTNDRPARYQKIVAGHHLLGQLLRDFPYLRERHRRGELSVDFAVPEHNPFEGSEAKPDPERSTARSSGFELSLHN
jgi:isopenicillin N synthase-like dioxygenase